MKAACIEINVPASLLANLEKQLSDLRTVAVAIQESGLSINACGPLSRAEDLLFQAEREVRKSIAIMKEEAHA